MPAVAMGEQHRLDRVFMLFEEPDQLDIGMAGIDEKRIFRFIISDDVGVAKPHDGEVLVYSHPIISL